MSDWRDDDLDEWPDDLGVEGVRVVGEGVPGNEPAPSGGRFPLPGDSGTTWSASEGEGAEHPSLEPPGSTTQLPHWTEPPTGQVPRALGGTDDDFEAWAPVTAPGPRFRTGDADWAEADWTDGDLFKDETMGVGSPARDPHAAPPRRGRRGRRDREAEPDDWARHGSGGLEGAPVQGHHDPYEHHEGYEHYEEPGGGAPDLIPRVATAGVVAVVALVAFAAGRPTATALVTLIIGVAAFELYAAFQRAGYNPATILGLLGCAAMVPIAYNEGERAFPLVTILVVAFTFLWYLVEVVHARPIVNVGLTLLPFGWIGIFGGFAGMLLAPDPGGTGLLLGVVICAVGSDTVGYFVGRAIGRTQLMPRVSPNKTVEGLIAGAVTAIVLGGVVGKMLHPWADEGLGAGIVLGILVAITAPLGDLVESMIKRDLGVKDLGSILPGHGGFLDRFDAILFTRPVAYYWALHLFTT